MKRDDIKQDIILQVFIETNHKVKIRYLNILDIYLCTHGVCMRKTRVCSIIVSAFSRRWGGEGFNSRPKTAS